MEYTPEQLNYFRMCYIAFNLVPKGLRKVFRQEWDFRYKTRLGEWKETPQNGRDFYSNETRRSRTKNARYLATIQIGNTAEWDCSCLFFAILYSDSIGTTLSPVVSKEVDDLRKVRNDIAHINEPELTDVEFQNFVAKVLAAFNSLKLSANDVKTVKNQTSFPTAEVANLKMQADNLKADLKQAKDNLQTKEEEVQTLTCDLEVAHNTLQTKEEEVQTLTQEINTRVESFCSLTFKPSHEIFCRQNEVTRIMEKLQELGNGSNGAVSTIYLSGIPGCGKSQIARQVGQEFFDKRSRESKGLTFVATLNAATLETLADSYMTLGKQVGITEYTLTSLATSKVDSPKEALQHLTRLILPKMKQFCNWLIIADDVVDFSLVRSHLPSTASEEWGNGQVLITTQDSNSIPSNAPHTYHESLSEGMQPDDALKLLKQVSQIPNQEQAEKVAEVLEYQPLALAAAGCYVQEVVTSGSPNFSWTSYLEALSRGEREATEEPLAKQNLAYSKTMTTAVKMAVDRASESDEVLRDAFYLFSLCAPDSLPVEAAVNFVKFLTTGQTEELIKAKIVKSSLITCSYDENGVPAYLRVHNFVHGVLKTILTSDTEFANKVQCLSVAIKVFLSLLERDKKLLFASGDVCVKIRTITTHCKVLHDILTTYCAETEVLMKELRHYITPADVVSWLCSTAQVCSDLSNPANGSIFSTTALEFIKYTSGTRDGDLLKAKVYDVRGNVTSLQCENKVSLSYYEQARAIRTAIYGEDHQSVAGSHSRLGSVYLDLGEHSQAKEHHEKALIITKKVYGEQHVDVAASYNNLGIVYRNLGQHSQAKKHHEKALIIRKKIYGEQHASVAASYNNLGVVYCNLGQHSQAKKHYEKALIITKKVYGEQHADVAASYNNLGAVYGDLGQHSQAKEHHEKALIIRKKVYGEHHASVAESYNNLGVVYSALGQHSQAKEHYEKALIIRKKVYGEQHADVAASYNSLGVVYGDLGQHSQAKEHYEKALIIRKKVYGEQHADVAASYYNLGLVYGNLGQHSQAREHYEKALIIRKKVYGEQHADVAASYNNLGVVYHNLGQHSQAKEHYEKALIIRKKVYGEQHADVAASYNNLGVVYHNLGQHSQAKEHYEKALIIRKKVYGEQHADVAASYNNLGVFYRNLGQHSQAKEHYEKALIIRKKVYGEQHASVAESYNKLGNVYSDLKQYVLARECYEKALNIYKAVYGEQHAAVGRCYRNLTLVERILSQATNKCCIM